MKKQSIFNLFGCADKNDFKDKLESSLFMFEELFPVAQSYKEHYEKTASIDLSTPNSIVNILLKHNIYPDEGRHIVLELNHRNILLEVSAIEDAQDVTRLASNPLTSAIICVSTSEDVVASIKKTSESIGITCLDQFITNYDYIASKAAFENYPFVVDRIQNNNLANNIDILNSKINYKARLDTLLDFYDFNQIMKSHHLNKLDRESIKITDEEQVNKLLSYSFQFQPNEHVVGIFYDKNNTITSVDVIGKGSINVSAYDMKYISHKLSNPNIAGIMLAHNHPSGIPEPSNDDLIMTKSINQMSTTLKKELYDHVIIGKYSVYSMDTSLSLKEKDEYNITFSRNQNVNANTKPVSLRIVKSPLKKQGLER